MESIDEFDVQCTGEMRCAADLHLRVIADRAGSLDRHFLRAENVVGVITADR